MSEDQYTPITHGNPQHIDPEKLDSITLADYGWTPATIKSYMFGIYLRDPETGAEMGDDFYNSMIETAISRAEQALDIAIFPRRISGEHHDYYANDYNSYMYVHTFQRPILQVEKLRLEMNGRLVYDYPTDWWKVYTLAGHIQLFPTTVMPGFFGGATGSGGFGAFPNLMGIPPSNNGNSAPQMLHVDYIAGMIPRSHAGYHYDWEVSASLEQLIIKYALVEIFQVWGRLIIGAGIASRQLIVDGISESIDTTQSAMYTGSAADIELINKDISDLLTNLKSYYGMNLGII